MEQRGWLESMADAWVQQRHNFERLDPVSQNLKRAGNGMALLSALTALPFAMFGVRGVGHYVGLLFSEPGRVWPYALGYVGLFAFGLIRLLVGASRAAGVRDALKLASALVVFAISSVGLVYLWMTWPWVHITTSALGYWGLMVLGLIAGWETIASGTEAVLLCWPRSSARDIIRRHIDGEEFSWDQPRRRPWWQFWKR